MCQLQECQSIRSGTSVLPYYRTPLVCVPDVMGGASCGITTKKKEETKSALLRWLQVDKIQKGARPPAAGFHQGCLTCVFFFRLLCENWFWFRNNLFSTTPSQEQVAGCCLDAGIVPILPFSPPTEHEKVWVIAEELCNSWSLSHLGYSYPGTTPVMIKLDHNRSCPWV